MDDCMRIVRRLTDAGKLRQADKVRSYIRTAFSAGINARGDASIPETMLRLNVQTNPARDIAKIEGSSNAKDRALTLAELRAYWRHVQELPEPSRSIATIHLLTGGQRQQQLARVTLDDIDRDDMTISILDYKGKRKDPRLHTIPILPEVFEAMKQTTGTGNYIFSCNGGKKPVSTSYLNDVVKRICNKMDESGELEKGHFTAGSLRATVETRLAAKP
jgi:integrase